MGLATVTVRPSRLSVGLLKRVATTVVVVPPFVWLVSGGPAWLFVALVLAVAAAASWELRRLLEPTGRLEHGWLGVGATVAVAASFAIPPQPFLPAFPAVVVTAAVAAILTSPVWLGARPATESVAFALLAVFYVGWLLGHAIWLRAFVGGVNLVLFLVGVTWAGESAAYLVGSALGRHKLAPLISPSKTLEGALAHLAASVAAAVAFGDWLLPDWSMRQAVVAGVILGVVGQLGDLAESAMKRSAGVKDTSGLLPGHGGVLDRVDGLLFNGPALYYYVALGGAP
jgi:phosphatidate cytidylyltransferase